MRPFSVLALIALALPATALAQLTSGASSYDHSIPGTSCTDIVPQQAFQTTGTDYLYQHFMAIGINGADACRLHSPTTDVSGGVSPDLLRRTYANFAGVPLHVIQHIKITEMAPGLAIVVHRLAIENQDAQAHTINAYAYFDFDFSGTQNTCTGSITAGGNILHDITSAALPNQNIFILYVGADGDDVQGYATVRSAILGTPAPDYTVAPFSPNVFGPADYTGGAQWKDRVIPPGMSMEVVVAFGIDYMPKEGPPALAMPYGASSGSGTGVLTALNPAIGNAWEWRLLGGAAGQPGAMLYGISQVNVPILGLTLLTSSDFFIAPFTLDATGTATSYSPLSYWLFLGVGASLYAQALYIDPTSPASAPASTTNGVSIVFGY